MILSYKKVIKAKEAVCISYGMDRCRHSMFQKNFDMIMVWLIVFPDTRWLVLRGDFREKKKASRKDWLKGKKNGGGFMCEKQHFFVLRNSLNIRYSHRDTRVLLKMAF